MSRRALALATALAVLGGLFAYSALRAGPLAPVPVVLATVESSRLAPAIFGVGTIEARYAHKIGPTVSGRVAALHVDVGDAVRAGQTLGEMDPIDLAERVRGQEAGLKRAQAAQLAAEAQARDTSVRHAYAASQADRYARLFESRAVSREAIDAKRQERQVAEANLAAAQANLDASRHELARARADLAGLVRQQGNLRLVAPASGIVVARYADPGTTVTVGQAVVEVVDPATLWIGVRFDQLRSSGLAAGLPVRIALRSRPGQALPGRIARVDPVADTVTEELLAKVAFDALPSPPPPIGELAEVTVALPVLAEAPVVPNAAIQYVAGRTGVWSVREDELRFLPVRTGASDLDGRVQILEGVRAGERIVVHSRQPLDARSRIEAVERIPGTSP